MMRKTFITIFTFVYLASGVGFGSVQHYCHTMQKTVETHKEKCCCEQPDNESGAVCHAAAEQQAKSCCDTPDSNTSSKNKDETLQSHCCDIEHNFIQTDLSAPPVTLGANPCAEIYAIDLVVIPEYFVCFENDLLILADPSIRLNLPLLI